MAVYITKKQSWIRFLASLVPGAGIALLLCSFFNGPRLGPLYDFLIRRQKSQPISPEILLIDTSNDNSANFGPHPQNEGRSLVFSDPARNANILEPSAAASLLLTSVELGASTLIVEAPILGLSAGASASEDEIRYRFNEEFNLLGRNISSLFDAIRTGSVGPQDAGRYVSELINLSEQGKERLVSNLVRREAEGIEQFEKTASIFGNIRHPGNLLVQVIRLGDEEQPQLEPQTSEYIRAKPDRDGVIRRAVPVREDFTGTIANYHIVYEVLKDSVGLKLPLDNNGAVIFGITRPGKSFHKVHIKDFLDYDEAGRSLRRLLGETAVLGIYRDIEGENNPMYLWDYALSLKDELLKDNDKEKKDAWIKSCGDFFAALDSFLYGPSEMKLVMGYEEIIASEAVGEEGEAMLAGFRDTIIGCFAELRQKYEELKRLRQKLSALDGAFCILGPFSDEKMSDAEVSALLANCLLTGRAISPGPYNWLLLGAFICVFLTALILRPLKAASTLITGLLLSFFSLIFFAGSFIFSGIWLEPLVPSVSALSVTIFSFGWAGVSKYRFSRLFHKCYAPVLSKPVLKKLIAAGKPNPSEMITVRTAVAAVRDPGLLVKGDLSDSRLTAEAFLEFRGKAVSLFMEAGAAVFAGEGDMLLAYFGSPPEREAAKDGNLPSPFEGNIKAQDAPAVRAAAFVSELLKREECRSWHYGLDIGACCFTWTALSGYSGFGRPVIRAAILSRLVSRYRGRPLVSESFVHSLKDWPFKKLAVLKNQDGSDGEAFYELLL
ncbi:MAG: hypothetical protein LBH43_02230 [Treponema sp.]|nr:hypothetical protein [Treponema sp.]